MDNTEKLTLQDEPFTIFAPENGNETLPRAEEGLLTHPDLVKRLLLDHIVLGVKIDLQLSSELTFSTLGGRTVQVQTVNGTLYANGARVLKQRVEVPHGILVILDNYLFPEDMDVTNMTSTPPLVGESMTGESLVKVTAEAADENDDVAVETTAPPVKNSTGGFLESVTQVLSFLKREEYTVFVPTDHAFQRWHPIDWGFYPFSVPEFTDNIIVNHFVKGNLHQDSIKDGQTAMTLGGQEITFARKPNSSSSPGVLTVNGVQVVKGDTPVSDGNMMFLGEVLFVDDEIVKKLQQSNRDKETAPLLAFPWMRSQFLSHAFLMLEEDPDRFTHITRFLNLADIAPHIAGKGYTFFVPTDKAFEKAELSTRPDNFLSKGEGLQILLNHFVKGRLYNKDLTEGKQFHTLGDKVISVGNNDGGVMVNNANILESEIFVYNLGTMYYIDRVLFVDEMQPTESNPLLEVVNEWTTEIPDEVERIPSEIADERGGLPDLLEEEEQGYNITAHYHEENDLEDEPEEYDDVNYNHPETISHQINSTGLIQDDSEDYDGNVTTSIRPPR
uniref:(California timema) hypothetical protein n=1 Tax=Timema californicum TaxID=61474 RepID=A0A7R9J3G7_TIMCA|nr:unnamed protein product [Timema californicum]